MNTSQKLLEWFADETKRKTKAAIDTQCRAMLKRLRSGEGTGLYYGNGNKALMSAFVERTLSRNPRANYYQNDSEERRNKRAVDERGFKRNIRVLNAKIKNSDIDDIYPQLTKTVRSARDGQERARKTGETAKPLPPNLVKRVNQAVSSRL